MPFTSENFDCPCCGAEVSAGASFCRECGASDESGWSEEVEEGFATDDDFDYGDYLEREFSIARPISPGARLRRAFVVTIIVLVCMSLVLLSIFGM
ncbi:MAG: zinc ribbon domain-containing protein [Planctomycetota bacterium]|nr:zinc ribbon domain-containing protein [Planctomycetota bacterium]